MSELFKHGLSMQRANMLFEKQFKTFSHPVIEALHHNRQQNGEKTNTLNSYIFKKNK